MTGLSDVKVDCYLKSCRLNNLYLDLLLLSTPTAVGLKISQYGGGLDYRGYTVSLVTTSQKPVRRVEWIGSYALATALPIYLITLILSNRVLGSYLHTTRSVRLLLLLLESPFSTKATSIAIDPGIYRQ